ncbi:E3 ubiquitin-protein ligase E3D-like [Lineus longissimus]|uniref:E3 ubiquitin-protein ligase E3D-like n=1 Tax=Lineus longissimus TaxID=88925 RepID=UPI00315D5B72
MNEANMADESQYSRSAVPILYVEMKPRLSVVQFVLYGCLKSYSIIRAEKNTLTVRVPLAGRREQYKFTDFTVDPLSSNGLNVVSGGEMQWRMTLKSLFGDKVNETANIEENSLVTKRIVSEVQSLLEHGGVAVSCRNCGKKLFVRDRPFSKVLPLPSDGWQEVAENWFCHKEKDDVPEISRLQPRQDEILIGETDFYMALNKSVSHCFRLKENSGDLVCDRCARVIGAGYKDHDILFAEVYIHSVIVTSSKENEEKTTISSLTTNQYCDVLFSRLLLDQAQVFTSFRFIVESKVGGKFKPFILVWLMDQQAYLGTPDVDTSAKEVVFVPVVKLLYQGCIGGRNKETAELWSRDMTVHSIELPSSLCLKVLSSLIEATKQVPPSLRYLNGFHVGHLRR